MRFKEKVVSQLGYIPISEMKVERDWQGNVINKLKYRFECFEAVFFIIDAIGGMKDVLSNSTAFFVK